MGAGPVPVSFTSSWDPTLQTGLLSAALTRGEVPSLIATYMPCLVDVPGRPAD